MASRVNTRFVLILVVSVVAALGIVGGLWGLQVRGDATRNIRAGDEYLAQGEFKKARSHYGRAVSKEPTNVEYVAKMEAALLRVRPQTTDEAGELYRERLGILRHRVRYNATDPQPHLALIEELVGIARLFNQPSYWQLVAGAADDMWERVPASSPKRIYAKLYRGVARRHLFRELTEEEVAEAEGDLLAFVEAVPDSDLGWASLAGARLAIGHQHDLEGKTRRATQKLEEAQETVRRALEAVPDGPEVAMVVVDHLLLKRRKDEAAVSEAEMAAAVDHMVELVEANWSPTRVNQATQLLVRLPSLDGPARAAVMLQRYLFDHPDAYFHRLILARLQYALNELDTAYETAAAIVDAEPLQVSFLANVQLSLRTQAASQMVDIECRRWNLADAADKANRIEPIEAAVRKLVSLVGDAKDHSAVIRAEGKLAVAKGDFETGAAKLERLVRSREADLEVYKYVALALDRLGQYGRALDRVDAALVLRPGSATMLVRKAQLQYKLARFDEAGLTVKAALALNPENVALQELASVAKAMSDARAARSEGDLESARATQLEAFEAAPDSVLIIGQLIGIELEAGLTEEARTHLKKGLELQPNNDIFLRLQAALDNEDPVLEKIQYAQAVSDDEGDLAVRLVILLDTLATQLDARAAADPKDADRLRGQAANARQEAERYLVLAKQLRPDDPRLLEHLFTKALFDKDWAAAEPLVERARDLNSDQADGLLFEGRYHFMREDFRQAVRAFTEATDRKPYSSPAWRLLALAYERVGNFGEARDAYEQAYRCNPTDIMTLRRYIPALLRAQEKHRALQIVQTARKLLPRDVQVRELWLQLEADVGSIALALHERREIYRRTPVDRANTFALAALLGRTEPPPGLIVDESGRPRYTETQWRRLSTRQREQLIEAARAEWRQESDAILDTYADTLGDDLDLTRVRAALLRGRGEVEAGEQLLIDFLDRQDESATTLPIRIALGQYQEETGRFGAALMTLQRAVEYQDPDLREADAALGDLFFSRRRFADALRHLERVLEVLPSRAVRLQTVECRVRSRQLDEAQRELQKVIEDSGPDYFTTMLEAALAEGRADELSAAGDETSAELKYAEQREKLALAQERMPLNPTPHVRVAQSLLKEYRRRGQATLLEDALLALDRADDVQAATREASLVRVDVLVAKENVRGAIGELTRLLERSPDDDVARRGLVQLYVEDGNVKAAVEIAAEAIERNPTLAWWHEMIGDLHLRQGDVAAAFGAFERALRWEASSRRLSKFAELAMELERPDYAQIIETITSFRDTLDDEPILRSVYARALDGVGRRDDALQQMAFAYHEHHDQIAQGLAGHTSLRTWYRTLQGFFADERPVAVEQFVMELCEQKPDLPDLRWLAGVWAEQGSDGISRAIELQREAVERGPEDDDQLRADLYLDLGKFLLFAQDIEGAIAAFETSVGFDADDAAALNNLAYLTTEIRDDPQKALPYAQRAVELKPDDAAILDTLGWVHFKLGNLPEAQEYLRRSIQRLSLADNHVHLAAVLAATGSLDRARTYLRRATELNPGPSTQTEIDRLAEELRTRGSGPDARRVRP